MTKILLSGFFCLFISFSAEACKPAPLSRPECVSPDVKINYKIYLSLLQSIKSYQEKLSAGMIRPQRTHSCFNNHFAAHYGQAFKTFLDKNNSLACKQQLEVVKGTIIDLISTSSEEFRAVKNKKIQKDLRRRGERIEAQLKQLFRI